MKIASRRREFDTRAGQRPPRHRLRELVSEYDGQVMKLCCCDYPLLEPRIRLRAQGHGYRAIAEALTAHSMTKAERKDGHYEWWWIDPECPPVPKRAGGGSITCWSRECSRDPEIRKRVTFLWR